MAVFLATPDDVLRSGEVHTRQNIIDEHRLGQSLQHLSHKLLVFKATDVRLPSNINPAYERLPLDDPDWIVEKIVEQAAIWGVLPARASRAEETLPDAPVTGKGAGNLVDSLGDPESEAAQQAADSMKLAIDAISTNQPGRASLDRAELAVAGLYGNVGESDTLGVHLANRLFSRRHEIKPRAAEVQQLIRAYLANVRAENVPGVYWLKDLPKRDVIALLVSLAENDGDASVRAGALRLLGRLRAPVGEAPARKLAATFLRSGEVSSRRAGLEYVRLRGERRLRDLLDDPALLEWDRKLVSETAALLDVEKRPSVTLARYAEDAYVRTQRVRDSLLTLSDRISRREVAKAMESSVQEVRLLGIGIAQKKGLLSQSRAREIIAHDRSPQVRGAALRWLVASKSRVDLTLFRAAVGKREDDLEATLDFDEQQALRLDVCAGLPATELRNRAQWRGVEGADCYEALGLKDPKWAARFVRVDLHSDFKRLTQAAREQIHGDLVKVVEDKLKRRLNESEVDLVRKQADDQWIELVDEKELGTFVLNRFRSAAMRVLAAHGRKSDIRFARRFARSTDQSVRLAALGLFVRFGTSHDSRAVLDLGENLYDGDARLEAARTGFRLAYKKHKLSVLRELRASISTRQWAIEQLPSIGPAGLWEAWELLSDENASIRVQAAALLWRIVRPEHSESLLADYLQGYRYYNVVREADELLYAPEWLQPALARDTPT
jgi:hypothetical protein